MKGHSVNTEPNSVINNGECRIKVFFFFSFYFSIVTTDEFSTWEQKKKTDYYVMLSPEGVKDNFNVDVLHGWMSSLIVQNHMQNLASSFLLSVHISKVVWLKIKTAIFRIEFLIFIVGFFFFITFLWISTWIYACICIFLFCCYLLKNSSFYRIQSKFHVKSVKFDFKISTTSITHFYYTFIRLPLHYARI